MTGKFDTSFENTIPAVEQTAGRLRSFASEMALGTKKEYVLSLVFEELTTNIIKYSYDDTAVHLIRLSVEAGTRDGKIIFILKDDGHAFNPELVSDPDRAGNVENMKIGGLGIHIVKKMSESLKYRRENGWNIVTVII